MGRLRAAAAKIDLAPPAGGWMTGFAARVGPATGTHDPLLARAVLLDDGRTPLAIISCDLLGLTPADVAAMRQRIAGAGPLSEAHVLICCTHTHSGPASLPMRGVLRHVDRVWLAEAETRIVQLVSQLPDRLAPARWAMASTRVPGIGYNRQDPSHPIDEELAVLSIETEVGATIATILNYAMHAVVLGPSNRCFSGDWPAAAARRLQRLRGGIGICLQGACGDVDPAFYRDRGWGSGTFEDVEQIGERLAREATAALQGVARAADATLHVASRIVDVPLDPPPPSESLAGMVREWEAELRQLSPENQARPADTVPGAYRQWAGELQRALEAGTLLRSLPAELFVAAIDDLRLVGLPFETYTDIGLGIKGGLHPLPTLFVSYANGLYGYCPTRWAKDQGGYGPDASYRWFVGLLTGIGYGADEMLVEEAIKLGRHIA